MTAHVNPLRLAVLFDGDQRGIRGMAQDTVGQLAETANGLGRQLLVKGAQTMDASGSVVNWSNWTAAEAFDQERQLQLAHCYRSNQVVLGALHPLAVENEVLATVDGLAYPPRFASEKIDAVLIATARDKQGISEEFQDKFKLRGILHGTEKPEAKAPLGIDPRAFRPAAGHRGLVKQGTRVYSLATICGVEHIIQEKLSAPTNGMSFHGRPGEVKELVDAMAVTLADPQGARQRLAGNRFAMLADLRAK